MSTRPPCLHLRSLLALPAHPAPRWCVSCGRAPQLPPPVPAPADPCSPSQLCLRCKLSGCHPHCRAQCACVMSLAAAAGAGSHDAAKPAGRRCHRRARRASPPGHGSGARGAGRCRRCSGCTAPPAAGRRQRWQRRSCGGWLQPITPARRRCADVHAAPLVMPNSQGRDPFSRIQLCAAWVPRTCSRPPLCQPWRWGPRASCVCVSSGRSCSLPACVCPPCSRLWHPGQAGPSCQP